MMVIIKIKLLKKITANSFSINNINQISMNWYFSVKMLLLNFSPRISNLEINQNNLLM